MYKFKSRKAFFSNRIITGIFSLLVLICLSSVYQNAFAGGVVGTPALVETQWLADSIGKAGIRTVYVGNPSPNAMADFGSKHIEGSMFLSTQGLLNVLGNGSTPPDKAKFEELMGKFGIGNDTHVVIYGMDNANPFSTNAFWLMKYFGHKKVSYLNGGIKKWDGEKRKTESGAPTKVEPAKYTVAAVDASILADADYVLKSLKNPKVAIVDTRGTDVFSGKVNENPANKRAGHIPGAIDLQFVQANLNSDGTFKSAADLKAVYESKGVTKNKEAITYCQAGIRAANTYFVLKHILGYSKVRDYVGSWAEWSNLDPAKYPMEQ